MTDTPRASTDQAEQLEEWRQQVKQALTDRQWEVVRQVPRGLTNGQISQNLGLSTDAVKSHLHCARSQLKQYVRPPVLHNTRSGLAVVCLRARQYKVVPCAPAWAVAMTDTITPVEREIVLKLAQNTSQAEIELDLGLNPAMLASAIQQLRIKLAPFVRAAGVTRLDNAGMIELFVRAGTIRTPAMRQKWRESVNKRVTEKNRDVLKLVVLGYECKEIALELAIPHRAVRSRLGRITAKLAPYAPLAGVVRPGTQSGMATITIVAGLDRVRPRQWP